MAASTKIIFGPPGTGKTTTLLRLMEQEFERGLEPEEIAFVSFTKAAVTEAAQRAAKRFNFPVKRLKLFRTLHSLAYNSLGMARDAVVTDYSDFAAENGYAFSKKTDELLPAQAVSGDDLLLKAKSLCDATGLDVEFIQREYSMLISPFRYANFIDRLDAWKKKHDRFEFSDLLRIYVERQLSCEARVAFVDEAQDLTPVQWRMVQCAFGGAERLYIAGDDDQALYHWAGASPGRMLAMSPEHSVLEKSYRVPGAVHALASRLIRRIEHRVEKTWRPREEQGYLKHSAALADLPLENGESWMLLARTGMTLNNFTRELEMRGVPYRYNGADCFPESQLDAYCTLRKLRSGESATVTEVRRMLALTDKFPGFRTTATMVSAQDFPATVFERDDWMLSKIHPLRLRFMTRCYDLGRLGKPIRVDVSTIHQAKGGEAENVALSPDQTTATAAALNSPGAAPHEHRAYYVGVTRAKNRLFLLRPGVAVAYPFGSN